MSRAERLYDALVTGFNHLGGLLTTLLMLLIVADITARDAFNSPITGVAEIAALSMVTICFAQMPHSYYRGRFIRSNIVLGRVGPRGRASIDALSCLMGIALISGAMVSLWSPLLRSWQQKLFEGAGAVQVPIYPTMTLIIICCGIFLIWLVVDLVRNLCLLAGKEPRVHKPEAEGEVLI